MLRRYKPDSTAPWGGFCDDEGVALVL